MSSMQLPADKEAAAMTQTMRTSHGLDPRRKRLLYLCWHRGTREMDIILGRFANAQIATLDDSSLAQLEQLVQLPDQQLYAAFTGSGPIDAAYQTELFGCIKAHNALESVIVS